MRGGRGSVRERAHERNLGAMVPLPALSLTLRVLCRSNHVIDLNPPPIGMRAKRRFHHRLAHDAVDEARPARTIGHDGINELDRLIVAERLERVALRGVALRARPDEKLSRDIDAVQIGVSFVADLKLQRTLRGVNDAALGAVDLNDILPA